MTLILLTVWAWSLVLIIVLYLCRVGDVDGRTLIDYLRHGIGPRLRW